MWGLGKGSTSLMNIFTPDGKNKHKEDYGVSYKH